LFDKADAQGRMKMNDVTTRPPVDLFDPHDHGFDADRLARIAPFLAKHYVEPGRLPNTQLLIARNGKAIYYDRQGIGREDGSPLRDDALFRIASMTKPVTSIAFMMLVEQGRIALEDKVTSIIPEFEGIGVYTGGGGAAPFAPVRHAPPMRMVDLMTHMSGLTYGFQNRTNIDAAYRESELDFARKNLTSDEFIGVLAKLPLEFAPGKGWNYSVSTDVLGIIVERLTGMRLGDYFEENIFGPLGMVDTAFGCSPEKAGRLVDAYAYRPGKKPRLVDEAAKSDLLKPGLFDSGGGGLVGSLADYDRFCQMLVGEGALDGARIISPKTLALMTANHLPGGVDLTEISQSLFSEANNAGTGFGLGFASVINPARTLMPCSLGEFYWGGAYSTAFFIDPVEKIHMVFMTQVYPSSTYPVRRQLKTLIYSALMEIYSPL
jgi:CubicO group peptidase (beta-lactamase class C family)